MGEHIMLFLETQTAIQPEFTEDDVVAAVSLLLQSPLFTRSWDFPSGCKNFLW